MIQVTNDDVKGILKFVNKQDTNKLIVSVMGDSEYYRKTYILKRGNYDTHGDEVQPGTPAAILPFDNSLPKNRLGLAEWLFSRKNPLAARAFVNQTWQEFFGKGIVKSSGILAARAISLRIPNCSTGFRLILWIMDGM